LKVELRYGRGSLPVEIPENLEVQLLHLNRLPVVADANAAIEESFKSPIGCAPLSELARGKTSACIVISDVTRPVPNETILTPMLACLRQAGIAQDKITILVATGLHRANVGDELEEMIGVDIARNYRVVNHDARDDSMMQSLGEVPMLDGTAAVAINKTYLEHDLKITTALIEPHLMAGYSGGRKLICPGIASAQTILQFHSPPMIGHAKAHTGNLDGNPVHAMSRAVAGIAGVDFICNVTLSEEREITGVFSGDMDKAHAAGIAHVDKQTKVPCRAADIVITTAAGYPLDTTLYQCVKGMLGALPAIKPGGTLILAASMSQGVGGEEFSTMLHTLRTPAEFIARISGAPVTIDQWQLQEMMQVLQKCEVIVVTDGVDDETLRAGLLTPAASVEIALRNALQKHGAGASILIIPEGPYVTPVTDQPAAGERQPQTPH